MFSLHQGPVCRLDLNFSSDDCWYGRDVSKDSSVPLVPDFPRNEHGKGRHGLLAVTTATNRVRPPKLDCGRRRPQIGVDIDKA